jgi:hypothetical protein
MILPGRLRVSFRLLSGALLAGSIGFACAEPPPADAAGEDAAVAETPATDDAGYALVGVVATTQGTLLSILREADNLSFWISIGGTRDDVTVVSYDARTERAIIRTAGQTLTLPLRDAGVAPGENEIAAAPSPAEGTGETVPPPEPPASPDGDNAAPAAPEAEPPAPPDSEAEQATEARMLVSDLLDIGQQQREAYEAAQKAAGHAPASAEMPPEEAPSALPEEAPAETPPAPPEESTAAEPAR